MRASKAKRGQGAAWLLLLSLLVCAGCNLQAPQSTEERFAGPPVIHIAAPLPEQIFRAGASVIVQAPRRQCRTRFGAGGCLAG